MVILRCRLQTGLEAVVISYAEQSFSRQPLSRAMNLVLGTGSSASSIIFNTTLVRPLRTLLCPKSYGVERG
tara:strand:+ start:803 stop:1015 length:213 start_codon:yes stop_codon:yes gene_type:complete